MIIQYIVIGALAGLFAILQATLLDFMTYKLHMDLLFSIVVILGIFKGPVHGSVKSFLIGFLHDVMGADIIGVFMTARLAVFIAAQGLKTRLSPDTAVSQFTMALILGVFDRAAVFIIQSVFTEPMPLTISNVLLTMVGIVINAAIVPPLYLLLCKVPGMMELPEGPRITR